MSFNNTNGTFQAMPFILQSQQPSYAQDRLRAEVPPRVRLACSVLEQLAIKTSVNLAGSVDKSGGDGGYGTLEVRGQRLTLEEQQTQRDAAKLLSLYFNGKLRECEWDGVREDQAEGVKDQWNEILCPACQVHDRTIRDCMMCGNIRKVKIARLA